MGFEQITGPNSIAPTPPAGDASNRVATTAFVSTAITTALSTSVFYPSLTALTNTLSSDHALTNTSSYFDGPAVAQGSSGTWFVSGQVTFVDTTSAALVSAKLWDGATVIDSAAISTPAANGVGVISLSGFMASPAGNLRLSVKDGTNTTGKILFNQSGNSKDSTIIAIRIA